MADALCGVRHPPCARTTLADRSVSTAASHSAAGESACHRSSRTGGPRRSPRWDTGRRCCGCRCASIESAPDAVSPVAALAGTATTPHIAACRSAEPPPCSARGEGRTLPSMRKNRLRATSPSRTTTVPATSISVRSSGQICTADLSGETTGQACSCCTRGHGTAHMRTG